MGLPQQIGYQGMHPRGGKQHRGIVLRNQGLPLYLGMAVAHKKFNIFGTQFVGIHNPMVPKNAFSDKYGRKRKKT
jgi:hypothetical protein